MSMTTYPSLPPALFGFGGSHLVKRHGSSVTHRQPPFGSAEPGG